MHEADEPRPFSQVRSDYARLEPGEGDTWNPLGCEVELCHRAELLKQLTWAVRASGAEAQTLRVLDVGCGNGRSTRMYLDLGLRPDQLTGIDLRPGAISRARATHPGIRYLEHDGGPLPFEEGAFHWISICTVFSSVRDTAERRRLGADITRVLAPGGHLFFWDLRRTNDFAGGDRLRADEIFPELARVWSRRARIGGFHSREAGASVLGRRVRAARETLFGQPTHDGVLLRR